MRVALPLMALAAAASILLLPTCKTLQVSPQQQQLPQAKNQQRDEQHPAPEPYSFSYSSQSQGGLSMHQESGDGSGRVTGFYTIQGDDGRERRVDYVADADGYRAKVSTNEIGTRAESSADAQYDVQLPSAGQLEAAKISYEQYKYLEETHAAEREMRLARLSRNPSAEAQQVHQQFLARQQQQQQQLSSAYGQTQNGFAREQLGAATSGVTLNDKNQRALEKRVVQSGNFEIFDQVKSGTQVSGSAYESYGAPANQPEAEARPLVQQPAYSTLNLTGSQYQVTSGEEKGFRPAIYQTKGQTNSAAYINKAPAPVWQNNRRPTTLLQQQMEQQFIQQLTTDQDYPRQVQSVSTTQTSADNQPQFLSQERPQLPTAQVNGQQVRPTEQQQELGQFNQVQSDIINEPAEEQPETGGENLAPTPRQPSPVQQVSANNFTTTTQSTVAVSTENGQDTRRPEVSSPYVTESAQSLQLQQENGGDSIKEQQQTSNGGGLQVQVQTQEGEIQRATELEKPLRPEPVQRPVGKLPLRPNSVNQIIESFTQQPVINIEQQREEQEVARQEQAMKFEEELRQEEKRQKAAQQQQQEQQRLQELRLQEQRQQEQKLQAERLQEQRRQEQVLQEQLRQQQLRQQQLEEQQRVQEQILREQRLQDQKLQEQKLQEQRLQEQRLQEQRVEEQRLQEQRLQEQRVQEQRLREQQQQQIKQQEVVSVGPTEGQQPERFTAIIMRTTSTARPTFAEISSSERDESERTTPRYSSYYQPTSTPGVPVTTTVAPVIQSSTTTQRPFGPSAFGYIELSGSKQQQAGGVKGKRVGSGVAVQSPFMPRPFSRNMSAFGSSRVRPQPIELAPPRPTNALPPVTTRVPYLAASTSTAPPAPEQSNVEYQGSYNQVGFNRTVGNPPTRPLEVAPLPAAPLPSAAQQEVQQNRKGTKGGSQGAPRARFWKQQQQAQLSGPQVQASQQVVRQSTVSTADDYASSRAFGSRIAAQRR